MKMMNVSDEELLNDKQQTSKSMKSTTNYNVNSSTTSQKRPMNAFLIFCKRHRSVVKQKYPHLENRSITKILGEWWAKISHQDKQKYTELARQYKEAFLKANPGFKWYKSDIKIDMQSCSPPSYVSFTNNTTTINNTNASLNCNLFNNGNYQSDNDNIQKQSNGSNMTNQSDLNSHISTNKNDKLINNNNEKQIDKANNFAMTNTSNNSSSNNLTPKPPKKRYLDYLENEFKEPATQTSTNSTNSNILASTSTIKNNDCKTTVSTTVKAATINEISDNNLHGSKNYAVCGGPPVLDIETMNRVIENAFGPADDESNTITTNKKSFYKTSTNNKKSDFHLNLFPSSNRKNQSNKDNTKQQENLTTSSTKSAITDNELKLNDLRCNEKFNDSNEQFDNKTINKESRSNSPINSVIVDKFINANNNSPSASSLDKDKLNNKNKLNNKQNNKFNDNESNDKPLNLSSTTTVKKSQQVLIDNLIEKFLSNGAEGNPMPIEMLQNSTSYTSSSSSSKQNAQRKQERSCKGKRYLEMLNENQMRTKRNKSASNSSICNNGDELNSNNKNQTSSKWVSGNFDLEEKIRDFEEINFDLEEHDLKNVLDSNTKTNSDKNETSSSFSTSLVANDQPNNILLNNNEHNKKNLTSSSSSSSNIKIENNKTNTFNDKQLTENLNENRKLDSQLSNSSADLAEKIVERLNLNSQTLECNGLVALAAAAEELKQAAASSVPPSCT